jgi:hypothetical protein
MHGARRVSALAYNNIVGMAGALAGEPHRL